MNIVKLKTKDGRKLTGRSYGFGWVTSTGELIHKSKAKAKVTKRELLQKPN